MTQNLNLFIAFLAGLLTFFSPCFFPLVPVYLVYITGLSFEEVKKARAATIAHSLLFILGFTIVFMVWGLTINAVGDYFCDCDDLIRVIGGGLVIFLGLYLMGVIKLPFLDIERKITISNKPPGYLGTIFVGIVFALAWSPCVGPILAGILVLAGSAQTVTQGVLLLLAYSLGLGIPLFLFALAVNYSLTLMKKIEKYLKTIHFVSGIFLVLVGILLATNYLAGITQWLIEMTGYEGV
jgi:cytochrome c-type biogenesis protein